MTGFDDNALYQWHAGEQRRLRVPAEERAALDRAIDRIVARLRRRLGGTFSVAELVELYELGTEWCLQVAVMAAPNTPAAWDMQTVADAAFARYVREACDYAGGRRLEPR